MFYTIDKKEKEELVMSIKEYWISVGIMGIMLMALGVL